MAGTIYSDVITTSVLPDSMRVIFSNMLEFTARPTLVFDQPQFVEEWPEFGAKRGATVTRTVFHQLPRAIAKLVENQDVTAGSAQDHQVSLSIAEYGSAEGTSEFIDTLSYLGPTSSIVKTLLGPQMALTLDSLAKLAYWYAPNINSGAGPTYRTYANGARADRAHLTATDNLTADMVRQVGFRMSVRRVPLIEAQAPSYIAICHPSVAYDLRNDTNWKDANLYAGSTRIFNGEVGMMHGVRFLQTDQARIANGGALNEQTTLQAGTYNAGTNSVSVASTTGFAVGQEITLHHTGVATTAPPAGGGGAVSWVAPDGQDPLEETLVIKSISGSTITFTTDLDFTHSSGDYMTEALDVYPTTFVGGVPALAKGIGLPPEVRVALPTDRLRRMTYVGWYAILGYGVARDWSYELLEICASQNVPLVYAI